MFESYDDEPYFHYEREHFTIDKSEGTYGPIWVVTAIAGPLASNERYNKQHYVLRSTEHMDYIGKFKKTDPSVMLDVTYGEDPIKHSGAWKGAFRTKDMNKAVDWLIETLNDNQVLTAIEQETEGPRYELGKALEHFAEATEHFPRYDVESRVEEIKDAFAAFIQAYELAVATGKDNVSKQDGK